MGHRQVGLRLESKDTENNYTLYNPMYIGPCIIVLVEETVSV